MALPDTNVTKVLSLSLSRARSHYVRIAQIRAVFFIALIKVAIWLRDIRAKTQKSESAHLCNIFRILYALLAVLLLL